MLLKKKIFFFKLRYLNFKNFNIEFYINHQFYKISFIDGKITSELKDIEYSNYYLLKIRSKIENTIGIKRLRK